MMMTMFLLITRTDWDSASRLMVREMDNPAFVPSEGEKVQIAPDLDWYVKRRWLTHDGRAELDLAQMVIDPDERTQNEIMAPSNFHLVDNWFTLASGDPSPFLAEAGWIPWEEWRDRG